MALQPCPNLSVLVGGIDVEDCANDLACWNIALDGFDKTDELLMPMALHVLPEDLAGHDVQRREQRGRGVALILMVVGHGRAAPLLERQARLSAIKRLDPRLFVPARHDGMGRRRGAAPDEVVRRLGQGGIVGALETAPPIGREAVRLPDLLHRRGREAARPTVPAMARAVWRAASWGGGFRVIAAMAAARSPDAGVLPGGRVLS